jgi:hypothetical protein
VGAATSLAPLTGGPRLVLGAAAKALEPKTKEEAKKREEDASYLPDTGPGPGAYSGTPPGMRAMGPADMSGYNANATTENELPSNSEMGAPLGSPDTRIVGGQPVAHLFQQEHVDGLAPGTPFYWADHPDAYVKV